MLSIIIPIYNEEKILCGRLNNFKTLSQIAELIFVDGRSNDGSIKIAASCATVLTSQKGRAIQMNCGARHASNDILLFLHADNIIFPETVLNIENKMRENHVVGGCLTQLLDNNGVIYRIIEGQGNLRARLSKIFYGDQGIFVRRNVFFRLGGFPEVPIFEDALFTRKLKTTGKTLVLGDKIIVSSRRWETKGILKTFLLYNLIIILFGLGGPLEKIKLLYDDLR